MRRAQDGDRLAYERVLRAMLPAIKAFARRRVYDEVLVEDVVQDTLLTVHRLRHTYDPSRPLLPWLAAITSARSIDALRRCGRSQAREIADADALASAIDPGAPTDGFAVAQDLHVLLGKLPARQRMVLEMIKLREMTLEDAARESSLSVSAIKSLLHRAFIKLREHRTH
ncbi:MAG: sigma-70 family RNA polymerase sigma factor [Caulobacteraceae bacterium]